MSQGPSVPTRSAPLWGGSSETGRPLESPACRITPTPVCNLAQGDTQHTHQAKPVPDRGYSDGMLLKSLEKAKATLSEDEMPELPQQ